MSTMNREVYEALKAINVPDEKASAAATSLSDERQLKLEGKVDKLVWMVGFNLVISAGLWIAMLST